MEYNFAEIESKWQKIWADSEIYKVNIDTDKPKYYVLDMFPYPSGAGLHVGHPLGYIASDIFSRYKRLKGFNVLHPMGFDAFGLPAEQYAVQTGTHPAKTTEINIKRYRQQLDRIGLSYDWSRKIVTSDPNYYKWTQWVFIKLFSHWFDNNLQKARPVSELVEIFETEGNSGIDAACKETPEFSAPVWNGMSDAEKEDILMNYRLTYRATTKVNWCPELGVLANDEVKDGLSVRGSYQVIQKDMEQWLLRITAYSERLLNSLDTLDWSDSLKEMQRNWIGKSEGAEVVFKIKDSDIKIEVFTTRPDTIFGATFMVIAPESELVQSVTTIDQTEEVDEYIENTKNRTERERISEVKNVTGVFSGSYAINPFNGNEIPVWIADYVLAGYGTGAIMAVPAHDSRDYLFAKTFNLPIIQVVEGGDISESSYDAKNGTMMNSDFLNGLNVKKSIKTAIEEIEKRELGKGKVNYRLRDAIFSRQRYWGEPFPVYYNDGIAYTLDESKLPLILPQIDEYKPTETGEPPLGRAENWNTPEGYPLEISTMPGFAGSSAYYLRYMDPHNDKELVSAEAIEYWQNVDLYIGGTEHAVGHLLYSRFWNKFLFDLGYTIKDEPFNKLVNQGMIQGRSNYVYRIKGSNIFVSKEQKDEYEVTEIHVDVNIVNNDFLDIEKFKQWRPELMEAEFILNDEGKYLCGYAVEKMSKSLYNVVNPDDIVAQYGADTLRMYEMFLGPVEQSKPWDTNGIEGVHRFLKKLMNLFYDNNGNIIISNEKPTEQENKILHTAIKKVDNDIQRFSFNTAVSAFMICVNELSVVKCNKKEILEQLIIILSPFAPHLSEELWQTLNNRGSVIKSTFPEAKEEYLTEKSVKYPVAFNGKTKFTIEFPAQMSVSEIEALILKDERTISRLENSSIKKLIVVPGRMINIVI